MPEWDRILPFACYYFNPTPTANDLESPFFLIHGRDLLEGHARLLGSGNIRYFGDNIGLILFAKLCKLWLTHTKSLQENLLLKTGTVERNKNFKSHSFKVGQLIEVKNHLRNTQSTITINSLLQLHLILHSCHTPHSYISFTIKISI